jgi:hypothetical protein
LSPKIDQHRIIFDLSMLAGGGEHACGPARVRTDGSAVGGVLELCFRSMSALKDHVQNGRLAIDGPTDLPEGEVVYSQPVDAAAATGEIEFAGDERRSLYQALDNGIAAARAGDHTDAEDFVADLLART